MILTYNIMTVGSRTCRVVMLTSLLQHPKKDLGLPPPAAARPTGVGRDSHLRTPWLIRGCDAAALVTTWSLDLQEQPGEQ